MLIAALKLVEYLYLVLAHSLEILEVLAAGLSTREIAERLFVSENTAGAIR